LLPDSRGSLQQYIKLRTLFLGEGIVEISKERFFVNADDWGIRAVTSGLECCAP
jgi:hypothetical protein